MALPLLDSVINKVDGDGKSKVSLLGLGNPLLDISSPVDDGFMKKYGIKPANAILAEDKHLPMYQELSQMESVEYIGGGATLNTIRVCSWMLQEQNTTGYMGCIGVDDFGEKLKSTTTSAGVDCFFMEEEKTPTGTCAVCVTGKERSLVANLAAANEFKKSHCEKERAQKMIDSAQIVYSAGFFLTVSPDTMMMLGEHCRANQKKTYCLNLSAEFICQFFKDPMLALLPLVDILFSNEDEAKAFAAANEIEYKNMKDLATKVSKFKLAADAQPRTYVLTQGSDPVIVAKGDEAKEYPVHKIAKDRIVDTNGAGDAFVGGFLSQFVRHKEEADCVAAGNYAASYMIQRAGTKLEGKPKF